MRFLPKNMGSEMFFKCACSDALLPLDHSRQVKGRGVLLFGRGALLAEAVRDTAVDHVFPSGAVFAPGVVFDGVIFRDAGVPHALEDRLHLQGP